MPEEYWGNFIEYFDHIASNDTCIETKYGTIMKGTKTRIWDWIISFGIVKHVSNDVKFYFKLRGGENESDN